MTHLWLRLMAWLFGPDPVIVPVARSIGTGPVYLGGSVRAGLQRHPLGGPPAKLLYDLAASAAQDGEFEAAASYLIEASRRGE